MKLYLLLKNVPELKHLTREERGLIHRSCYQQFGMQSWKTWLGLLLYGLCGGCGVVCGKLLFQHSPVSFYPAMFTGTMIGVGVGFSLFRMIIIGYLRPYYPDCIRELKSKPTNSGS